MLFHGIIVKMKEKYLDLGWELKKLGNMMALPIMVSALGNVLKKRLGDWKTWERVGTIQTTALFEIVGDLRRLAVTKTENLARSKIIIIKVTILMKLHFLSFVLTSESKRKSVLTKLCLVMVQGQKYGRSLRTVSLNNMKYTS